MPKPKGPTRWELERKTDDIFLQQQGLKRDDEGALDKLKRFWEARRAGKRARLQYEIKHPAADIDTSILDRAQRDVDEAKKAGGGGSEGGRG